MEKAIEIKRRAQRFILNGDLDGALSEYEKLVASGDADPYHSVLLADLLYKKGDAAGASRRYLEAVDGYEGVGLFKNAIAVCKKLSRLSLAPEIVLRRLAKLHALDGLATESSLYYMQHADLLAQIGDGSGVAESLREAFHVCPDNVRALERLGDLHDRNGAAETAARTLLEAAERYERLGQLVDAGRCRSRAEELHPGISEAGGETEAKRFTESEAAGEATPHAPPRLLTPSEVEDVSHPASPPALHRVAGPATAGGESGWDPHSVGNRPEIAAEGAGEPEEQRLAAEVPSPPRVPAPLEIERVSGSNSSPSQPGLDFGGSLERGSTWPSEAEAGGGGLPEVSILLNEAHLLFERGDRDAASMALVRAAQTYDRLGRLDNAAAIYRNLSKVSEAPLQVMMLWLKNCQRRDDRREAARVACELGDRALSEGDAAGAREWFERARAFDATSETAARRLERMQQGPGGTALATVTAPEAPAAPPAEPAPVPELAESESESESPFEAVIGCSEDGGVVQVSVRREEPMGVDLGSLISEFRRHLEVQLASDPQGNYDLGMAYREMGLLEEAIASFRLAEADPMFQGRVAEMIGRCLLDRGDFDGAANELRTALSLPAVSFESALDLGCQLGLALEAGGRLAEALDQFERIYTAEANYPDVANKIRSLRRSLGRD